MLNGAITTVGDQAREAFRPGGRHINAERKAVVMDVLQVLLTAIIGTSVVIIRAVVIASRLSRRVRVMLWGE